MGPLDKDFCRARRAVLGGLLYRQPWCDDFAVNLDGFKLTLTAVFEPAREGGFTCHFEELPEVFSEGETLDEAKANLVDALAQVMEYHRQESRKTARPGATRQELELFAA